MKKILTRCAVPAVILTAGGFSYFLIKRRKWQVEGETANIPHLNLLAYYEQLVDEYGEEKANAYFYLGESL